MFYNMLEQICPCVIWISLQRSYSYLYLCNVGHGVSQVTGDMEEIKRLINTI